jgi:phosphonate transport system substrate-binding protein
MTAYQPQSEIRLKKAAPGLQVVTPQRSRGWMRRLESGALATLLFAGAPLRGFAAETNPANARTEIHFAFSKTMFAGVNENDARAAWKVYAQNIGDQNGLYVNDTPLLLDGTNAIARAMELKQADLFVLAAEEFIALEHQGLEGPLLLSKTQEKFTEDYLLLAHEDGGLRRVEDLKGRSLNVPSDARSTLSRLWLEVLCREHGLGPANQVLARIASTEKTPQAVLPVFFGKADACVVTRNGWEVMCELNPQLKMQLRIVAASPSLVPTVTCFRHGFSEKFKQRTIKAVELSSTKPSFQQIMVLFKSDQISSEPLEVLKPTRELVAIYHQFCGETNDAGALVKVPRHLLGEMEGSGNQE